MNKITMVMGTLMVAMAVSAAAPVVLHKTAAAGTCYYLKKYSASDGGTVCANDSNDCMACVPRAK